MNIIYNDEILSLGIYLYLPLFLKGNETLEAHISPRTS